MRINRLLVSAAVIAALGATVGTVSALESGPASAKARPGFALDATTPETPGFTIDQSAVKANGSGCPAGSVQTQVSPDQTALTVLFSEYTAHVLPGDLANTRKACTTTLPIRVPSGFTWGVTSTTYRGFAEMNDGVTAYQGASYFFQGGTRTARAETTLQPDDTGYWALTDQFENVSWAPCDSSANLVITSSLRLQVPNPTGIQGISQASMDTQDTKLDSVNFKPGDMKIGLHIKKCD
jgi:hypothetical protein